MPSVRANLDQLAPIFCSVFRENSKRTRIQFFSNELVQHMWQRYTLYRRDYLLQYFCEIINVDGKQSDAYVLLKDILVISNRLNFEVLRPDMINACSQLTKERNEQAHFENEPRQAH